MSKPTRKSCVVPKCKTTTTNSPDKLFFIVPLEVQMRKKWIKAMNRLDPFAPKSKVHCCEDHFDVETDMESYLKYKMMGGRHRLKKGVIPHKFACQKEGGCLARSNKKRKQMAPNIDNLPHGQASLNDTNNASDINTEDIEDKRPDVLHYPSHKKARQVTHNTKTRVTRATSKATKSDGAKVTLLKANKLKKLKRRKPLLDVGVSAKSQAQKKKLKELKKKEYNLFQEYANDSTDEESLDVKQNTSDDADNSDDDKSEERAPATEKVYLKSISLKQEPSEEEPTSSKRARLESAEDANYTDELYEFGKYVAEQLMCLDVEDARIAQAEITAVLSKFNTNKIMRCFTEPSTSNVQPIDERYATEVTPVVSQPQLNPVVSSVAQSGSKLETLLTQSRSPTNAVKPTEIQSGSSMGQSLKQFAVVNVNSGASSMVPVSYVVVPIASGTGLNLKPQLENTEGTLDTQFVSEPCVGSRVTQSETSHVTYAATSVTEPGSSSMMFSETLVKIEPDSELAHSNAHLTLPSEECSKSVSIKFEPNSEDET